MSKNKAIKTNKAPHAAGHYSQGIISNGFIFVATQLPIDPQKPDAPKGSIIEQAEQVLKNVIAVVQAGGGDIDTIARISIYVSDTHHWDDVNKAYEKILGNHKPARGVLEINNIRKGYDVSMEAIASIS